MGRVIPVAAQENRPFVDAQTALVNSDVTHCRTLARLHPAAMIGFVISGRTPEAPRERMQVELAVSNLWVLQVLARRSIHQRCRKQVVAATGEALLTPENNSLLRVGPGDWQQTFEIAQPLSLK